MLGVPPALGRHFNQEDDRAGAEPVVILSDEVWVRRYNGDRGIIGRARHAQRPSSHRRRRDAAEIQLP